MASWLILDSLYCPEAFFCSHLDSYSTYLRAFGEDVRTRCLSHDNVPGASDLMFDKADVLFMLDQYDLPTRAWGEKRIAQVAAVCSPMPWEVKDATGAPMYHAVVSSIPWMVAEAEKHGCKGFYVPLAFDTRARACGMGVKRDLGCVFVGTTGANHVRRTQLLAELADVVTVMPPVFGREYFRTLARAKLVLSPHAEWARGALNNMRMFEAAGMGAIPLAEGQWPAEVEPFGYEFSGTADAYALISDLLQSQAVESSEAVVLRSHTYESRIPALVSIARSL